MATQANYTLQAVNLAGYSIANTTGWTNQQVFAMRDDLTRQMAANTPVLMHPLDAAMPRGNQAAVELCAIFGFIFIITIDPTAGTIIFTPDVSGMAKRKEDHIPRWKNCFVIYRLDKAPQIKLLNPDMSNNDISKVAAIWWRNASPEEKAEYRRRAEAEKRQHAIDHPTYQYRPRKPSEKKKRMTKNKLAKLAAASRTASNNSQHVQQQPLPAAAPIAAPQFSLDESIAFTVTGGDPSVFGTLPTYNAPPATREQARAFDAFAEQSRQDMLDSQADSFSPVNNYTYSFGLSTEDLTVEDAAKWNDAITAPLESEEDQAYGATFKEFVNC